MAQEDIVKMARKAGIAKYGLGWTCWEGQLEAFAALVAAHERESVAASSKRDLTCVCGAVWDGEQMVHAPRKREWVGLTDEEVYQAESGCWFLDEFDKTLFARAIEAKLKEKNG